MFCDENLYSYYKTNFDLLYMHKFDLEYLDNMIPYEKEIYINLVLNHLMEEKKRAQSNG